MMKNIENEKMQQKCAKALLALEAFKQSGFSRSIPQVFDYLLH